MVRLAARRRSAVNEIRDLPDGGCRIRKQRLACLGIGEVTDPRHRQFRPRRGLDRGLDGLQIDIGKDGTYAVAHQGLRYSPSNTVARTGYQRCIARGIERLIEQTHMAKILGQLRRIGSIT
jgi:hypothetical protein